MVANFRCNELKEEALALVKPQVAELQAAADSALVEGFAAKCERILGAARDFYADVAKQYAREVFEKVRGELEETLTQSLYQCFDSQLKMLRKQSYDKVTSEVRKLEAKPLDEVGDRLSEILTKLVEASIGSYERKADALVPAGSGWEQKVSLHKQELQGQLDLVVQTCKDKLLAEVARTSQKVHEDHIKQFLYERVNSLGDELAAELKDAYVQQVELFNENLQGVLATGFGLSAGEVFEFLAKSERASHEFCVSEFKIVFRQNANQNLLRKFNDAFKKDEQGKRRDWKALEEAQIKDVFDASKAKVDQLLAQFRAVIFPSGITKLQEGTPGADGGNAEDESEFFNVSKAIADSQVSVKRTMSLSSSRILSEEDLSKVESKFAEDVEFVFEEAIRAHKNTAQESVPFWLWLALAWFASDNIMGWIASPIFFYPLVLIAGVCVILHQLGILELLVGMGMPVVRQNVNNILAKTPIPIRI